MTSTPALDDTFVNSLRGGVMRLARRLRLERAGSDLTLTQLSALWTLYLMGPSPIGELASAEHVKPPSMTRTVNCLEEMGLVVRESHDGDGRQVMVTVTPAAEDLLTEDRRRRTTYLAERLSELDDDERATLAAAAPLLERLAGTSGSTPRP
ncbi:MarR family transcriptional regulator [soil metagenome]